MGFWRFLVLQSSFPFILELPRKKRVLVLRVAGASKPLKCSGGTCRNGRRTSMHSAHRKPTIGNWVCYTVICEVN